MSAIDSAGPPAAVDSLPANPALCLPSHCLRVPSLPVDLWYLSVDDLSADLLSTPLSLDILSPLEHRRLDAFRFDRDRLRFLAGRLLLRSTLSRYTGIAPALLRFVHNSFGRPELAPLSSTLRFNLSRAGALVVLAVSRHGEVGVDVEDPQRGLAAAELAPGVLAPEELAHLRAHAHAAQNALFLEYWVLKEAYAKARGLGLSLDVRRVRFTAPSGSGPIEVTDDTAAPAISPGWKFTNGTLLGKYPFAIAWQPHTGGAERP